MTALYDPYPPKSACPICLGGRCIGGTGCISNAGLGSLINQNTTSGPMPTPTPGPCRAYDFTSFDEMMADLQEWREDDHEDHRFLHRSEIIDIIEGVKALEALAPVRTVPVPKERP